jgi:hypothetical protein
MALLLKVGVLFTRQIFGSAAKKRGKKNFFRAVKLQNPMFLA